MDAATQANQFLEKFIKPIVALVVVLVIAGVGYHFHKKGKAENKAKLYNEFFVIKKELQEKQAELTKVDAEDETKKAPPQPPEPAPEELKAAVEPTVNKLLTFIKANQGTIPALEGALLVSQVTIEYKDEDKAIEALTAGTNGVNEKNFLYGIAKDQLADLLQKKDKCNEAAQIWESLLNSKDHAYLADSVRLKAGVCYEEIGMTDKAEQLYQKVVDVSPNTTSGKAAKKFLLHLKFKKSQKTEDQSAQNDT